jgi:hypothetical protein
MESSSHTSTTPLNDIKSFPHALSANLAAEAEQQQLLKRLQRSQRSNAELLVELDSIQRTIARLRSERK